MFGSEGFYMQGRRLSKRFAFAVILTSLAPLVASAGANLDKTAMFCDHTASRPHFNLTFAAREQSSYVKQGSKTIYQTSSSDIDDQPEFNFDFDTSFTSSIYLRQSDIENPQSHHLITYWSLSPDRCSVIGVPEVQITRQPPHGSVRVVQPSPFDIDCKDKPIILEGSAVYYTPNKGFVGTDYVLLTVAFPPYKVPEPRKIKVEILRWKN
jgi:hypothetical protein